MSRINTNIPAIRAFHQLHRDRKTLLYVTTIPEEDREVRELLTSGRANSCRFASSSTASRKKRLLLLLGLIQSVERVEFFKLSSAAKTRSSE